MRQPYPASAFDAWAALAADDPTSFERMRQALIDDFIDSAPPERRARLRSLQWRIEQERARAKSPLGACIRLSRMMWERVLGPGGLLEGIQELAAEPSPGRPNRHAQVIPFPSIRRRMP